MLLNNYTDVFNKIRESTPSRKRDLSDSDKLLYLIRKSSSGGTLQGRKKLTKLVFFAEHWVPDEDLLSDRQTLGSFDFIIYKYGPFSRDLMDVFDELKDRGLIRERRNPTGESEIEITEHGGSELNNIEEEISDQDRRQILEVVDNFGYKTGGILERQSLRYLGITPEEKSEYMGMPVDVIIAENQ